MFLLGKPTCLTVNCPDIHDFGFNSAKKAVSVSTCFLGFHDSSSISSRFGIVFPPKFPFDTTHVIFRKNILAFQKTTISGRWDLLGSSAVRAEGRPWFWWKVVKVAKAKVDEAVLEAEASLPKHTEGSCCVGCLVDGGEEWWLRFLDTVSCLDEWFLVYGWIFWPEEVEGFLNQCIYVYICIDICFYVHKIKCLF